jgi:two-component system OmpR family sensor kinase
VARLFISLYLFITIALIGLSAGLEQFFDISTDPENAKSLALIAVLEEAQKQQLDLLKLGHASQLDLEVLFVDDIAWPDATKNKLSNRQAVILHDPELGEQIFIALNDSQIMQLTLASQADESPSFFLYSGIFFILLGLLIALWIWPLWRDLTALKQSVGAVHPDGTLGTNKISKSSLIGPIADALNAMSQKVKTLMQSQRELTGAVAHEFRTPLSRLKFALAVKPEPGSSPWDEMKNDVSELERLVQEMLDYAGTEAQIPEMNLAEIPVKELCQQVLKRLTPIHLGDVDIQLMGVNASILADGHFIERAMENLLLNARRYAKKQIRIQVSQNIEHIDIAIEDDGIGIDEALWEKIFEPFFRPDEARDRSRGGAGLGLAIVKRIQLWHEGSCWVEKSSLGGAKFVLRYPNRLLH